MQAVGQVLDDLLRFPGVRSALLAGREGLVIQMRGETAVDGEMLAAVVPTLISDSLGAGQAVSGGGFRQCVVEFDEALLILTSVDGESFLAVAVRAGVNIGRLLYTLERERERLKELV